MRIPLANNLTSRDGTLTKDTKILNGVVEGSGEQSYIRKRFGTSEWLADTAGQAQLLTNFNGDAVAVIGDNLTLVTSYPPVDVDPYAADVLVGFDFPGADGSTTITPVVDPDGYTAENSAAIDTDQSLMFGTSLILPSPTARVIRDTADSYLDLGIDSFTIEGYLRLSAMPASTGDFLNINRTTAGAFSHMLLYVTNGGAFYHAFSNSTGTGWASNIGTSNGVITTDTNYHFAFVRNGSSIKTYINGTLRSEANVTYADAIFYPPSGAKLSLGDRVVASEGTGITGWLGGIRIYFGVAKYTANFTPPTDYYTLQQGLVTTDLSPLTPDLQFTAQQTGPNSNTTLLMLKNEDQAWVMNESGTVTAISDIDYPGNYTVPVTTLTRSGTTVTCTVPYDVNFQVGATVTIAGATPTDYNGAQVITSVTDSSAPDITIGPIVTVTRSGTTATATCVNEPHGLVDGQTVTISGANQPAYNGEFVITYISPTQFSYTVSVTAATETPATTATGLPSLYVSAFNPYQTMFTTWTRSGTLLTVVLNSTTAPTYFANIFPVGAYAVTSYSATPYQVATSNASTRTLTFTVPDSGPIAGVGSITRQQPTVSSISRIGTTATVVISDGGVGIEPWMSMQVYGCTETEYNVINFTPISADYASVTYTVPVRTTAESPVTPATGTIRVNEDTLSGASFTFSIAGSPATPATGTITATSGRSTVPGIVYLDGTFYVMDIYGVIYNCSIDDPQTWNALDFLTAQNEPGSGVALAKSYNYVVAFKEWSTEFFYNAGNAEGSPLSRVDNGFTLIGCASGSSVANLDGALFWVSQVKQQGRGVHMMMGTEQSRISTPDVERVLNRDDLSEVYAYGMKIEGHALYVLTLTNTGVTLVFDMTSKLWYEWNSLTLNASTAAVTGITQTGGVATVTTDSAHGLSDGDPVYISGANQAAYNGIKQARVVTTTTFQFDVDSATVTPATGTILFQKYDDAYFNLTHFTYANSTALGLHETNGTIYSLDESNVSDNGVPIDLLIRTGELDDTTTNYKVMRKIEVIGNKVSSTALIRWTDDDYVSYSTFRPVDLDNPRSQIRRCGNFRRRAIELRHTDSVEIQLSSLEV